MVYVSVAVVGSVAKDTAWNTLLEITMVSVSVVHSGINVGVGIKPTLIPRLLLRVLHTWCVQNPKKVSGPSSKDLVDLSSISTLILEDTLYLTMYGVKEMFLIGSRIVFLITLLLSNLTSD